MLPRTIAIYQRVSTEDQAREGFSLANQEESNRAFIHQKFGTHSEIVVYQDVESGFSVERKFYLRLLSDCQQRKIDAIVIWRIDRFTRNTSAGLAALSDLTVNLKIPVYSVTEGQVDFNDPNNKLMNTFLVGMAEFERNRIQQRVMPGMKHGAKIGHYQGTRYVILGARYNKPMQRLEWIPSEVTLLKILFQRVANGEGVRSVARYLYTRGYRNRVGKPMTTTLLYNALKREIYTDGYYRWNDIVSEKPILEPFIDRATWEKANEQVGFRAIGCCAKGKQVGSRRDDSPYVLQGVLKCRYCKGNLIGHGSKGFRYYVCSTYFSKTKAACQGQWIKAEPVEEQAREILKKVISNKDILAVARHELTRITADRNPEILAAIRLAERQLSEFDARHRKLLDLHYKDSLTGEQFKIENQRLLNEINVVKEDLEQMRHQLKVATVQNSNLARTLKILEDFDQVYGSLSHKGKKDLFNWVFNYAEATCLGIRKPKFIDKYELAEPFNLLQKEGGEKTQIDAKNQCESSSIQLSHMAGR